MGYSLEKNNRHGKIIQFDLDMFHYVEAHTPNYRYYEWPSNIARIFKKKKRENFGDTRKTHQKILKKH